MSPLPPRFASIILTFASLFHQSTWRYAQQLLVGAILAPGIRTVASVLRSLGQGRERHFVNYHRVLNRAPWSPREASRRLVRLLLATFVPDGPLVFGIDDTLERRHGRRIRAKGVFHDTVRSRGAQRVTTPGLRWLSVMLLAPIPWAQRVWALPVLTALAPNARYHAARGVRHKSLTDWARQLLQQLARWCRVLAPERPRIVVADATFATLELLAALAPSWTCITRVRLDLALYAPAPPRRPGTRGAPRKKGARLPGLATVLRDPATRWQRVTVAGWYGNTTRLIELTTGTGVWYSSGKPVVPLRWVLVRDPAGAVRAAGPARHGSDAPPRGSRAVLRAPLAGGGHVRGSAAASWARDAAPVVGSGDCADDAGALESLLPGDVVCDALGAGECAAGPADGVVSEGPPDLQRRLSRGSTRMLAPDGFLHLVPPPRASEITERDLSCGDRTAPICHLTGQSRGGQSR
jgi:DDE superfamily endonuclease